MKDYYVVILKSDLDDLEGEIKIQDIMLDAFEAEIKDLESIVDELETSLDKCEGKEI